jgi:hypothetical protein
MGHLWRFVKRRASDDRLTNSVGDFADVARLHLLAMKPQGGLKKANGVMFRHLISQNRGM